MILLVKKLAFPILILPLLYLLIYIISSPTTKVKPYWTLFFKEKLAENNRNQEEEKSLLVTLQNRLTVREYPPALPKIIRPHSNLSKSSSAFLMFVNL
ncbi:hypothetical protein CMK15_09645 [Candidatus Poribacteria bacterium]|nr:hypothetical protein [Candidatus Poribacteria bacterium]